MHLYIQGLLLYVLIFSIWDFCNNKYYIEAWKTISRIDKFKLIGLLLFHNVLYYFIYFSIFFIHIYYDKVPSKYILYSLILTVTVKLSWLSNNNRCWFTEKQNEILGIDSGIGFRDFYSIIFNKYPVNSGTGTFRDSLYNYFLYASSSYALYLYLKKIRVIKN